MNLFATDFVNSFKEMLKSVLTKAIHEILDEINDEEKFLLNRKEISAAIGCDPDTFDKSFINIFAVTKFCNITFCF